MCETIKGAPLGPRIIDVVPNDNFELLLTFSNGEQRVFDARPLLEMKVYSPLKNLSFFKAVKPAYGTIVWPQDIDCCPDTLYMQSIPL